MAASNQDLQGALKTPAARKARYPWTIRVLLLVLASYSLGPLFFNVLLALDVNSRLLSTREIPLTMPTDIIRSGDSIYISSTFDQRVLVYSIAGDFIRSYRVPGGARPFNMWTDSVGHLHVWHGQSMTELVYDENGVLSRETHTVIPMMFAETDLNAGGEMYRISNWSWLIPAAFNEKNPDAPIIRQSWSVWALRLPFPGSAFVVGAACLYLYLDRRSRAPQRLKH